LRGGGDQGGCTAFFVACKEGHLETVRWLTTLAVRGRFILCGRFD
jgi:hypothetical protein